MVMRAAQPVQRMPEAKLRGASMGCAEPHGHAGRQHRRCAFLTSRVPEFLELTNALASAEI
jgi:hypothetical protein